MKITWLGHACFMLEYQGFRVLLDPYQDVPGLLDISAEADAVYCSHDHFDHAYTEHVSLTNNRENPFTVREIKAFHDGEQGALRGPNTIRTFTAGGVTVAHLGDLGHGLSAQQLREIGHCDAVMIPVGGVYTVDSREAKEEADKLDSTVVIPMHYRKGAVGFNVLSTLDEFLELYPHTLIKPYPANVLELTADTPRQVAVLALPQSRLL